MSDETLSNTSSTAVMNAPIEFVDIPGWLFTINDQEFQRCSPAHVAAAHTVTDDGRRLSINVEVIGGNILVQHYIEDVSEPAHCRVVSTTDVFMPVGRTKSQVIWELSAEAIDTKSCNLTCRVLGHPLPEFNDFIAKNGIPLRAAADARQAASAAHVEQETPFYAKSIEKHALATMKTKSAVAASKA